uniref:Uncharacterized protein n=1 Tax=Myotis lucifugus TaxID=59463 RepID=G1Q4S7_MYOLU
MKLTILDHYSQPVTGPQIHQFNPEPDKYFTLVLTQLGHYKKLTEYYKNGEPSFKYIVFNEPGSRLVSRARAKTLAMDITLDKARFFYGDLTKVPTIALMVGMGTHMDAIEVTILITGAHRAFALYKAIEEEVSHRCTMSAFPQHLRTVFVCNEDATLELKGKTVKYFKGLILVHNKLVDSLYSINEKNRNGSLLRNHAVTR